MFGARRRRPVPGVLAVAALLVALIAWPLPALAREAIVTSFDGEPIAANFMPAAGLGPGERAPTILVGSGWGAPREDDPEGGTIAPLIAAGYNVLTWNPRGFHASGGTVMIDHRDFEGRDVRKLIDFVAAQPEAQLDGPDDPRVGMSGPSYGGGIQLVTAAIDPRVDAIAPTIAWNSLTRSLFHSGNVKTGWGLLLAGVAVPTTTLPGVFSPAGVQTGHLPPEFYDTLTTGAATGTISDDNLAWFADRDTARLLDRVRVPALIIQGTVDTLFTLEEAHRTFLALEGSGVPLKMIWFCGGHGLCRTEGGTDDLTAGLTGEFGLPLERKIAWFDRHLRDRDVDTGPRFEWIDEDGHWHQSDGYPLRRTGEARGRGQGTLALTPGAEPGSGVLIYATPSPGAVRVPIEGPAPGSHVVGEPRLQIAYRATGASTLPDGRAYIYAQLVDRSREVVVNNFATPVPITLDGERHELELPLERIASRATAEGYRLEIAAQTSVYDLQRASGLVELESVEVTLPVAEPVQAEAAADEEPGAGPGTGARPRSGERRRSGERPGGDSRRAGEAARLRVEPDGQGALPFTGMAVGPLAAVGLALLAAGLLARRRRRLTS